MDHTSDELFVVSRKQIDVVENYLETLNYVNNELDNINFDHDLLVEGLIPDYAKEVEIINGDITEIYKSYKTIVDYVLDNQKITELVDTTDVEVSFDIEEITSEGNIIIKK